MRGPSGRWTPGQSASKGRSAPMPTLTTSTERGRVSNPKPWLIADARALSPGRTEMSGCRASPVRWPVGARSATPPGRERRGRLLRAKGQADDGGKAGRAILASTTLASVRRSDRWSESPCALFTALAISLDHRNPYALRIRHVSLPSESSGCWRTERHAPNQPPPSCALMSGSD